MKKNINIKSNQSLYKVDLDFGSYFEFDPNVVIFIGTFYVSIAILCGMIVDMITPILDPRVRITSRKLEN